MMTLAAFCMAFAGFAALSLAMRRHFRTVYGNAVPTLRQRRALRLAGWTLLAGACAACVAVWGGSVGVVALGAVLSFGAFACVLLMTYAPGAVVHTGAAACVVGCCALVLSVAA